MRPLLTIPFARAGQGWGSWRNLKGQKWAAGRHSAGLRATRALTMAEMTRETLTGSPRPPYGMPRRSRMYRQASSTPWSNCKEGGQR